MAPKSPPPKNACELVVCWAVCYVRRLVRSHIPNDPLVGNLYAGQAVRVSGKLYPTAEKLANRRWTEEDSGSKGGNGSDLSFLEVLRIYGPEAFDNEVVWQTKGPRWQVQQLANEKEIVLIAENGGTLRNLTTEVHIKQTFNRQTGGKGLKQWYHGMHTAFTLKRQKIFKVAMEVYVAKHKSALVPAAYVSPNGHRLGQQLSKFRKGEMRVGSPNQHEIEQWAEALPKWAWNAMKTDEFRKGCSVRTKDRMDNESVEERDNRIAKMKMSYTPTFRENRSKLATTAAQKRKRLELLHARKKAVPFEPSKKKRATMRAQSIDFTGHQKNSVLYMISKDGLTIRRVTTEGAICNKHTVGPVVDPEPPDAFDSEAELLG